MEVKISLSIDGKVKMTTGSDKVRLDILDKWLGRNRDAILVKLEGDPDPSLDYKPGHITRIEEDDDVQHYNVFVGKHFAGQLPQEAITFSEQVDMDPQFMVSIVGKVEAGNVFIYIAE